MVKVLAQGKTITCNQGRNLREVLLENGIDLYNGGSTVINCRGIGTCGTCAVEIVGEVSEATWRDKKRHSLPLHSPTRNLRLACQTQVLGDIRVTKFDGFWGQENRIVWS